MAKIESGFLDLGYLDTLASGSSIIHRLDPRIKVLTTALFVICVVSFDKFSIAALLPFALFLSIVMGFAQIPPGYILQKLLAASPFAVMVGIFNPFFDQSALLDLGPLTISGGWISFCSILLRFTLTVSAMIILIATTGFNAVCMALERIGMPSIFAVQLLLLYRYIFVLVAEGQRMHRARAMRSFHHHRMDMRNFSILVGQLLLRTIDRGQRIHQAMLCRGFDGIIRTRRTLCLTPVDLTVFLGCLLLLPAMRYFDLSTLLGHLFVKILT